MASEPFVGATHCVARHPQRRMLKQGEACLAPTQPCTPYVGATHCVARHLQRRMLKQGEACGEPQKTLCVFWDPASPLRRERGLTWETILPKYRAPSAPGAN